MLWFYFKQSLLDNAFEVWKNAESHITQEVASKSNYRQNNWLGSERLVQLIEATSYSSSAKTFTLEERFKVIFGHESILPVISHV